MAYASPSVLGLQAAVSAGLAVTALSRSIIPDGLRPLTVREGFPALPRCLILLHRNPQENNPALDSLAAHIASAFGMWQEAEMCSLD